MEDGRLARLAGRGRLSGLFPSDEQSGSNPKRASKVQLESNNSSWEFLTTPKLGAAFR